MNLLKPLTRWLKKYPDFVFIVLLPMILGVSYLSFVATDGYVSESKLVVKKSGISSESSQLGLVTLLTGSSSQNEDIHYLKEYLASPDVLIVLEKKLGLRKIYSNPEIDLIHRLKQEATKEDFLEHFRSMNKITLDETTGIMTINSQAFSPLDAQRINQQMVSLAESYINNISYKIARDQTQDVEKQVFLSKDKLDEARERILEFQNKHNLLNPVRQAEIATSVTSELESEIVKLDADLKNMLAYMNPDALQVVAVRNRLSALRSQLTQEKTRITGTANADQSVLNELSNQYVELEAEVQFAEQMYRTSLAALEQLRVEVAQKIKSVVLITEPNLPERPAYPRVLKTSLTMLVVLLLIYFALKLVVATVRDHQD